MLPDKFLVSPYSAYSVERPLTSGNVDSLYIGFEGVDAGGSNVLEAAVRAMLDGTTITLTRTFGDGKSIQLVDDVTLGYLLDRSNHIAGRSRAVDGLFLDTGRHNLDADEASQLTLSLDWEDVDEAAFASSIDASTAKLRVKRASGFRPPRRRNGSLVFSQIKGQTLTRPNQRVSDNLDCPITDALFYGGELRSMTITVSGVERTIQPGFIRSKSAAMYRHEAEDEAPLMQLHDVHPNVADRIAAEFEVDATTGSTVVLEGLYQH